MPWTPGRRKAQRALEAPYDDVPDHLRQPLWNWIQIGFQDHSGYHYDRIRDIAIDLRIPMPSGSGSEQIRVLLRHINDEPGFMLDLVEALLERYSWDDRRAMALDNLLRASNSAYKVKDGWDGLELRVALGVKEAVQEAVDAAGGSAGDHLTDAWNEAYSRRPDPVKSYSETIKAVEAALAPHVSPQNDKQTLGTMIRDMAARPTKWEFEIANGNVSSVETVLNMMRVLWDGQTSRHGGVSPTRPETIEEARAALHLGATLVQWGVSSAFRVK